METPRQCLSFLLATLMVTAAGFGATATPAGTSVGQEPATPPSNSRQTKPREITLEERGDVCVARKNYDDAVDYYYRALRESSFKNPALWNKMGIAFQMSSKLRNARKAYSRATHIDSGFAEAWNNIGTTYFLAKKYKKSLRYYERAIQLKGDVAAFHINLGSSYYHLRNYAQAVAEYRAALAIDPKAINPDSSVGTILHASASDKEYYFFMAKALASVGNAEVAVRYLRRALEDGFHDHQRIQDDPDFKKISQYPAFVELMRNPPVAIKD